MKNRKRLPSQWGRRPSGFKAHPTHGMGHVGPVRKERPFQPQVISLLRPTHPSLGLRKAQYIRCPLHVTNLACVAVVYSPSRLCLQLVFFVPVLNFIFSKLFLF